MAHLRQEILKVVLDVYEHLFFVSIHSLYAKMQQVYRKSIPEFATHLLQLYLSGIS